MRNYRDVFMMCRLLARFFNEKPIKEKTGEHFQPSMYEKDE